MSNAKVLATLSTTWTDISGGAANIAGVTWQNLGPDIAYIAFTASAPAGGSSDAYHVLGARDAYYDENGSAKVWAKCGAGGAVLAATAK
jgi:hypothetical protein